MTTAKHTPGPWFGKKDGKYSMTCPWSIDHEDGHNASWAPVTTDKGRTLALVVNDDTKRPMDFQEAEMHANARLIAAAPKMLEALELISKLHDHETSNIELAQNMYEAASVARAAIAEALTGESK